MDGIDMALCGTQLQAVVNTTMNLSSTIYVEISWLSDF